MVNRSFGGSTRTFLSARVSHCSVTRTRGECGLPGAPRSGRGRGDTKRHTRREAGSQSQWGSREPAGLPNGAIADGSGQRISTGLGEGRADGRADRPARPDARPLGFALPMVPVGAHGPRAARARRAEPARRRCVQGDGRLPRRAAPDHAHYGSDRSRDGGSEHQRGRGTCAGGSDHGTSGRPRRSSSPPGALAIGRSNRYARGGLGHELPPRSCSAHMGRGRERYAVGGSERERQVQGAIHRARGRRRG